jgi:hypothetical protein
MHLCFVLPAATQDLEHFLRSKENPEAVAATDVDSLSWMVGHWQAEAFGGLAEDIWAPPAGGQMVGMFRSYTAEGINFYEIVILLPVEGRLTMRLKHFHADLRGWEEKDETVDFPLLDQEGDFWYFEGVTIHRESDEKMTTYLRISSKGKTSVVPFRYKRIR